jgi:hypothetical protein
MDSYILSPLTYFPDGLDESAIDALIEAADTLADQPEPTSAFLDGTTARRRERRVTRRKIRSVQPLPIRATTPDPDGWAA